MSRTTDSEEITTASARRRLKLGKDYYWRALRPSLAVGWRPNKAGAGTWMVRLQLPNGKTAGPIVLEAADDMPGIGINWAEAVKRAMAWAEQRLAQETGVVGPVRTVPNAINTYEAEARRREQFDWIKSMHVTKENHLGSLATERIDRISEGKLRAWCGTLSHLSPGNQRLQMAVLGAALRFNRVPTDIVKRGLPLPDESVKARKVVLTDDQVERFVAEAQVEGEDIGLFGGSMRPDGLPASAIVSVHTGQPRHR